MHSINTELVWFSATGTTQSIMNAMKKELPGAVHEHALLRHTPKEDMRLASDSLLVVGMPVYSGRIPAHCLNSLHRFKGDGAPAIAVVVYGNRDYDDALLELKDTLEATGFFLLGAAAFIARHSIFPMVATDRPDTEDIALAADFAKRCRLKLTTITSPSDAPALPIPGKFPYKEVKPGGIRPTIDASTCILCGACIDICPVNALTLHDAVVRDNARCIACGACIDVCPAGAQGYRGPQYEAASQQFAQAFSARREPTLLL